MVVVIVVVMVVVGVAEVGVVVVGSGIAGGEGIVVSVDWWSRTVNCCVLRTAYSHLRVANAIATQALKSHSRVNNNRGLSYQSKGSGQNVEWRGRSRGGGMLGEGGSGMVAPG